MTVPGPGSPDGHLHGSADEDGGGHGGHGGHGGWAMVLCCIPMVIAIVVIIIGGR